MMTSFNKKYFILSFVLFSISNVNAMLKSEKQKNIDSQLEQKLKNAECNQIITMDHRASKNIQDKVNLHNSRAQKICTMVEEYNQRCLDERKERASKRS